MATPTTNNSTAGPAYNNGQLIVNPDEVKVATAISKNVPGLSNEIKSTLIQKILYN